MLFQIMCFHYETFDFENMIQAWMAQLVLHQLGTMEVMGSNLGKTKIFLKNLNLNAD